MAIPLRLGRNSGRPFPAPISYNKVTGLLGGSTSGFRRLSFGKLRKTAINAIRDIAGGETAGVFACHGKPVPSDGLLDLYSNRDFRRVHEACARWGERLAPIFAAVPEPFTTTKRKHQTAESMLMMRQRVVELRGQGKTLAEVGAEVGLSIGAVRNHLSKACEPATN
ncbi:MAG: hypothetical protein K2W96_16845 [Gemmataceae bacterium]|nr:hypothetical protein [Gemmataceae bacterium]